MYLKELTLTGFKSFAKKGELEFSTPITAIVGPNGSGKSNVAESFRFVLGEQSVKAMRGKRGEDLIWGGSEKVARGNRAGVSVVFDNSKRVLALDFDEVKIERIVHRDGQNEYKLNDSTVRLKDIHELLAGANIGATGHHIISQGEADRILAANAKERREMIEDALGLKVYQLKKQEAERKLEKTHENINQVQSLRREAAPHLRYLKKQVEQAERSLEIQEQLKIAFADYLKREDVYIAFHHDRLTNERIKPAAELDSALAELTRAEKILSEATDTDLQDELKQAGSAFRAAQHDRQQAELALSKLQGQMQFLQERIERSATNVNEEEKLIPRTELAQLLTEIEAEAERVNIEDVGDLKNTLRSVVTKLKSFLSKHTGKIIDTSKEDKDSLHVLEKTLKEAEDLVADRIKVETESEVQLQSIQKAKDEQIQSNHELERNVFQLREKQRELSLTLEKIDNQLQTLERDRQEFKRELQEAVSLVGRGASQYFDHVVVDQQGVQVAVEDITGEAREQQRERRRALEKLKIRLEELGVGTTEDLLKEYKDAQERDEFLARELADLETSVKNLKELIADMQTKLEEQFSVGVEKISVEFNRFFTLMFGGGNAALKQVKIQKKQNDEDADEEEEVQLGVELDVSLPNKRVRGLDMLSGGERALTSIAVIFAMSQVNPPPFIILDETDAALDEANSRRYGDMIEELAKKSQLILITHNRETMSRAGILFGITMGSDGVSKILSVKFEEAVAVAK